MRCGALHRSPPRCRSTVQQRRCAGCVRAGGRSTTSPGCRTIRPTATTRSATASRWARPAFASERKPAQDILISDSSLSFAVGVGARPLLAVATGSQPQVIAGRRPIVTVRVTPVGDDLRSSVTWTSRPGPYEIFAWAGDRLLVQRLPLEAEGRGDVVVLDGPDVARDLAADATAVAVSPDPRRVLTWSTASGSGELAVVDIASGKREASMTTGWQSVTSAACSRWTDDRRRGRTRLSSAHRHGEGRARLPGIYARARPQTPGGGQRCSTCGSQTAAISGGSQSEPHRASGCSPARPTSTRVRWVPPMSAPTSGSAASAIHPAQTVTNQQPQSGDGLIRSSFVEHRIVL